MGEKRVVDKGSDLEVGGDWSWSVFVLVTNSSGGILLRRLGSDIDGWRVKARFLSSLALDKVGSLLFFFLIRFPFQSVTTLKRGVDERWPTLELWGPSFGSNFLIPATGGKRSSFPGIGHADLLRRGGVDSSAALSREGFRGIERGGTIVIEEFGRVFRLGMGMLSAMVFVRQGRKTKNQLKSNRCRTFSQKSNFRRRKEQTKEQENKETRKQI